MGLYTQDCKLTSVPDRPSLLLHREVRILRLPSLRLLRIPPHLHVPDLPTHLPRSSHLSHPSMHRVPRGHSITMPPEELGSLVPRLGCPSALCPVEPCLGCIHSQRSRSRSVPAPLAAAFHSEVTDVAIQEDQHSRHVQPGQSECGNGDRADGLSARLHIHWRSWISGSHGFAIDHARLVADRVFCCDHCEQHSVTPQSNIQGQVWKDEIVVGAIHWLWPRTR